MTAFAPISRWLLLRWIINRHKRADFSKFSIMRLVKSEIESRSIRHSSTGLNRTSSRHRHEAGWTTPLKYRCEIGRQVLDYPTRLGSSVFVHSKTYCIRCGRQIIPEVGTFWVSQSQEQSLARVGWNEMAGTAVTLFPRLEMKANKRSRSLLV